MSDKITTVIDDATALKKRQRFNGGLSTLSIVSRVIAEKNLYCVYECPDCGFRVFSRDNSVSVPNKKCSCGSLFVAYEVDAFAHPHMAEGDPVVIEEEMKR